MSMMKNKVLFNSICSYDIILPRDKLEAGTLSQNGWTGSMGLVERKVLFCLVSIFLMVLKTYRLYSYFRKSTFALP